MTEDVLEDNSRYEFENGIPADANDLEQDTAPTVWGRVTTLPFLTDAFSAAPGARARQDVGLDGLDDAGRADPAAARHGYASVPDPSADNFRHHLDPSYDQADTKMLGRYKNYNGMRATRPRTASSAPRPTPTRKT